MVKFHKLKKKKNFFGKGTFATFILGGILILIILFIFKKFCLRGKKTQNKKDKNTYNDSNDPGKQESRGGSSANPHFKTSNKEMIKTIKLVRKISKEIKK